jgi:hypothetical protein
MITLKATIFLDGSFWVGIFERTDKKGYSVARRVFGREPSDAEVYAFVMQNYHELKFGAPREFQLIIKRMNPKRLQREVRREMEKIKQTTQSSSHAQDYVRREIEKNKKEKKQQSREEKEARKEKQFLLKQAKKREKHRGH